MVVTLLSVNRARWLVRVTATRKSRRQTPSGRKRHPTYAKWCTSVILTVSTGTDQYLDEADRIAVVDHCKVIAEHPRRAQVVGRPRYRTVAAAQRSAAHRG